MNHRIANRIRALGQFRKGLELRVLRLGFRPRRSTSVELLGSLEEHFAFDDGHLATAERVQRVAGEEGEVRVFADLDGAEAGIEPELLRRVQRDRVKCLLRREFAVLHELGGFLVQVPHQFVVVRLQADACTRIAKQLGSIRDRVEGLDLVGPPIAEEADTRAVGRDFRSDLVAFEDVLQRANLHAEFVRDAEQHQDFVRAVAVRVNAEIAGEYVGQGFESQVAARLGERAIGLLALLVGVPLLLVGKGFGEGAHEYGFNPEAAVREAAIGALHVLAEGELDAARCVGNEHLLGREAVLHFHDGVLTTDDVGAAVEQAGRGDSAAEGAVNLHVFGIDHIANADLGNHGKRGLVHAAADGEMRVRVDDPGHHEEPLRIDDGHAFLARQVRTDGLDLAAANENVRLR